MISDRIWKHPQQQQPLRITHRFIHCVAAPCRTTGYLPQSCVSIPASEPFVKVIMHIKLSFSLEVGFLLSFSTVIFLSRLNRGVYFFSKSWLRRLWTAWSFVLQLYFSFWQRRAGFLICPTASAAWHQCLLVWVIFLFLLWNIVQSCVAVKLYKATGIILCRCTVIPNWHKRKGLYFVFRPV